MLRMKSLVLGAIASLSLFFVFISILSLVAAKLGVLDMAVYQNLSMIFAVIAILLGSFLAAKSAKGKGAVYGLILSGLWLVVTFSISAATGLLGEGATIGLRIVMYLAGGILGGLAGVSLKRKSKYI